MKQLILFIIRFFYAIVILNVPTAIENMMSEPTMLAPYSTIHYIVRVYFVLITVLLLLKATEQLAEKSIPRKEEIH